MKKLLNILALTIYVFFLLNSHGTTAYAANSTASNVPSPRSVTVQQATNGNFLKWKPPAKTVDGYLIYRSNSKNVLGNGVVVLDGYNVNSYTDSNIQSNTVYYYTVRSFINGVGGSTNTKQVYIKTKVVDKPTSQVDSFYQFTRPLSLGSSGDDVVRLQEHLINAGFLKIPRGIKKGYYGALTVSALRAYQKKFNLSQTGKLDTTTRSHINDTYAKIFEKLHSAVPSPQTPNTHPGIPTPLPTVPSPQPPNTNPNIPTPPQTPAVPVNPIVTKSITTKIELRTDKTQIYADNVDQAILRVYDQAGAIVSDAKIYLLPLEIEVANVWKTQNPSDYKFYAKFNDLTSNVITVTVTPNPSQLITSNVPKKFLTLVAVHDSVGIVQGAKFEDNIWEKWVSPSTKENDNIQIFDVTIWLNTNPKKISVYKFDRNFDPNKPEYAAGGIDWANYRESFNILNVNLPGISTNDHISSSKEYLAAFKLAMETIVKSQPAEHYGIKYIGHGSTSLFEGKINTADTETFLSYTNSIIGKKLDFLDWGTGCSVGVLNTVLYQYRYADFMVASDWLRGMYVDGGSMDDYNEIIRTDPTLNYSKFFLPSKTIKQSLIDIVDTVRASWEIPIQKNNMVAQKAKQSLSIYDMSKFEDLIIATNLKKGLREGDVLNYIKTNYPSQEVNFYKFRFKYVSNKDFFTWDQDMNGFWKGPWEWDPSTYTLKPI